MDRPSQDNFDSLSRRKRTRPFSSGKRVTPQERDLLWFEKIHQHGPLPASYLHAFSKHLRRNEKRAQDRLTDLFNEDRTPHGGPYLARPLQQFRTLDSRYMVSCITASIELSAQKHENITYIPQHEVLERAGTELRYPTRIQDPKTGKSYTKDLIPDALFGLAYSVKGKSYYRFFLLEADRSTEPATSSNFHRKSHLRSLLQYREYIGKGLYKNHLGLTSSLMVLNVFTEEAKLDRILKLTTELSWPHGNSYMLHRTCEQFGLIFKPPKVMPELLEGAWQRGGQSDFLISSP